MNVVFLDFDGVINTAFWEQNQSKWKTFLGHPEYERVSNIQAILWVSEFCKKYNYSIVVTSTWKRFCDYQKCLRKSGLDSGIKILGHTENFYDGMHTIHGRSAEIADYLFTHPEIERYLIFDDENIPSVIINNRAFDLKKHLVLCNSFNGFLHAEFINACHIHEHYNTIEQ